MKILATTFMLFVLSVFFIEMMLWAVKIVRHPHRSTIRKRMRRLSRNLGPNEAPDIVRKHVLSDVPILDYVLKRVPGVRYLERLARQACVGQRLGAFILLAGVLSLAGYGAVFFATRNAPVSVVVAVVLAWAPILYLGMRKRRRMAQFEKQLPEAMELIARALRAGHAFSTGMKLAADEFDDPLGTEFGEVLDEINFGVSTADALKNMTDRIDCPDLKYFVVSVILQRETGGNLAEIIENIARIIRERFKFHGKVRVLSAEGKLSAMILIAIPFVVVAALRFFNPSYLTTLTAEPAGRTMAMAAAGMMFLGILVIRRMIKINV